MSGPLIRTELARCVDCNSEFTRLVVNSQKRVRCFSCAREHKNKLHRERNASRGRLCVDGCGQPAQWRKTRCSFHVKERKRILQRAYYALKHPDTQAKPVWVPRSHSDGLTARVCRCGRSYACSPASGALLCPECALKGMPDPTPRSQCVLADCQ